MNRYDFQNLAEIRLQDGAALLNSGRYDGAYYYLLGYVIECALKACIAKQTNQYDFPDLHRVRSSYTHNLNDLLDVSGLLPEFNKESKVNPDFENNWVIVKEWNESKRYTSGVSEAFVRQYYLAVTDTRSGVLPWLQKWW